MGTTSLHQQNPDEERSRRIEEGKKRPHRPGEASQSQEIETGDEQADERR
jgi:hypothetical protein